MSLDPRTLYPNFHAETSRHASSSSPRPTTGKGTNRKKHELETPRSPSRQACRLPQAARSTGKQQQHQQQRILPRPSATKSSPTTDTTDQTMPRAASRSMPPLSVSACGSRPPTPATGGGATASRTPELSFVGSQPTKQLPPQSKCESPEDANPASDLQYLGKSRAHVLRGDLPVDAAPNVDKRPIRGAAAARTPSRLVHSLSIASLSNAPPLQEMVQCNARPRSRYARREIAASILPLPIHRLSQSASSPALSRSNASDVAANARPASSSSRFPLTTDGLTVRSSSQSIGTMHHQEQQQPRGRAPLPKPPILSWTEQDASSFFLTEIDAKDAADLWTIARALARGAHMLYAKREYEHAVACFADALAIAQQQLQQQQQHAQQSPQPQGPTALPLLALLHHHMGVAFHEDDQATWALMMQKKALELAQQCGDVKLQARALKALGVLFLDRDEPQKALDCQKQALTMALDTGDAELEARVYANLGNLASAQQQFHHAIACHERDLAACSAAQLDSAVGQARAHRNLALIYATMGGHPNTDAQLDHELHAARLEAANAFETDMRRHACNVVGNIYLQLAEPDDTLADMVATSVKDVLTAREDDETSDDGKQQSTSEPPSPEPYMI